MTIPKKILVPLDFSDQSLHALEYAKTLAKTLGASLELLHVVPNPYIADPTGLYTPLPQNYLDEFEREAQGRLEQALTLEEQKVFGSGRTVRTGNAADEIVECARARQVDLIIMGTHGRTGASHLFLGSVAERVVRTAPCPVLTVR
jgi:universal stress protein A